MRSKDITPNALHPEVVSTTKLPVLDAEFVRPGGKGQRMRDGPHAHLGATAQDELPVDEHRDLVIGRGVQIDILAAGQEPIALPANTEEALRQFLGLVDEYQVDLRGGVLKERRAGEIFTLVEGSLEAVRHRDTADQRPNQRDGNGHDQVEERRSRPSRPRFGIAPVEVWTAWFHRLGGSEPQ